MKSVIYSIVLGLALVSCSNTKTTSEENISDQSADTVQDAPLYNTHWKPVELEGDTNSLDSNFNKAPFIILTASDNKVEGHAGFNGFGGTLDTAGQDSIRILDIVATQIACPNLEVEGGFIAALQNANTYEISGDTLLLKSSETAILAKCGKVVE